MAKIRPLHPDIWTDEDFISLSPWARLLFMGLWNHACDNGHLEDRSNTIKLRILPADDVNAADLLREIEAAGLIHRADGWVTIPGAATRWRVDKRYFKGCKMPGCGKPERESPRGNDGGTPSHAGATSSPSTDGDGDGDGDTAATAAGASSSLPLIDPMLDGLRASMHRYSKLQHIRFDATPPEKVAQIRALIEKHGDERLVEIALKAPEGVAHVGWFLESWLALPAPGVRLAAVEQRFCTTHDWIRLSPSGACTACASERLVEGANA
jgi:hypothetical protein